MLRIALAWAALLVASPLVAQEAPPPDQSYPVQMQPEAELPLTYVPPAPPPPRRYSEAAPRHRAATHHRRSVQRHRSSRRHVVARRHHSAARHHAAHSRHRTVHLSKRTIRQCHRMSYRQIMRHKYCRALMRQELGAAEHRTRHTSHRHRHHSTRHHRSSRRHRR